jgi:hypothetical protein
MKKKKAFARKGGMKGTLTMRLSALKPLIST